MTQTMTPREQYEQAKRDFNRMRDDGSLPRDDHAELKALAEPLARLNEMADWLSDVKSDGETFLSRSVALEHAADLRALIAENEGLRIQVETEKRLSVKNYNAATARATEAERKLAEAQGLLGRTDPFTSSLAVGASELRADIRAFLSTEAERG